MKKQFTRETFVKLLTDEGMTRPFAEALWDDREADLDEIPMLKALWGNDVEDFKKGIIDEDKIRSACKRFRERPLTKNLMDSVYPEKH